MKLNSAALHCRSLWAILFVLKLSACASFGEGINLLQEQAPHRVTNHTLKELRDLNVVKQATDYSCGAASLATLLIYYYGEMTSEAEILALLQAGLTQEELQAKNERGFSLLDLKRAANVKGYQAAGFRLTPGQLGQLAAPVIVYVEPLGYKHFAVLRGVRDGYIYLADPSRGNLRMRLERFSLEWEQGIIFALGKAGEEEIQDYLLLPPVPFTDVLPEYAGFVDLLDQGNQFSRLPLQFDPLPGLQTP